MKNLLTQKALLITMSILVLLALGFSGYTAYRSFTLQPGQEVVVSGGTTIAKPTNGIVDVTLNEAGYMIAKYEDGTTKEIGYVIGKQGDTGAAGESIAPTAAQIAFAVAEYCKTDNRCDAKAPSPEQVAIAVSNYCATRSECIGPEGKAGVNGTNGTNGTDGKNASDEQIMAAVTAYCSSGRCTGPAGEQGIPGANGNDPKMSCVIRKTNNVDRQYVAWKYSVEPDTAYRNLYILPVWAQGENCVDLTA